MQYNPEELNEILNIFKGESEEIIQELNNNFVELEKSPSDKTPLKKLLQLVHSLKGASRMLGFNSIQDISHKLEDVLSFWKNDTSNIDTDAFQVIYEICDFLGELIIKCTDLKSDCSEPKVFDCLNKLEKLIYSNPNKIIQPSIKLSDDYIHKKSIDINAIVLELMFIIEKDNNDLDYEEITQVLEQNLKELSDIFFKTDYKIIKQDLSELYLKINNIETSEFDINFFKQKIPELRKDIYNLYKELNINSNINKQIHTNKPEEITEQIQETNKNENIQECDYILHNLQKIKYEKDFLIRVSELLKKASNKTENDDVIKILNKTVNLLDLFIKKDVIIDNDSYMVIIHCIYLSKRILLNEKITNNANLTFLFQRLNVIEDMFNIINVSSKNELIPQNSNNILNPQEFLNLKKNLSDIDLQEIKTLRIDSSKLDNLISQTGELLVNGIKTREHITELSKVNAKIIKWHSISRKIMNYLKYMEKKGIFNIEVDEVSANFYKRAQEFFNSNADMISEINNDFSNLYNMISEDNNKLHQSALEIETIAKGIRVLPLATIFHTFPRMIRDIAKEKNKQVDFIITGSDTTVDKKIIEEIKMPLIHILRNSIYHGIETPEERIKNNKDETGTIKLTSKQVENNIVITIDDDGYGINFAKVKDTARIKGLLTEEEMNNMSNEQIMKLLFLPGFSTAETINEISGRGIGLDVVKTKITNLNGDISIESVLNKGCRVTIKLPLSISTIKTFIININNQKYAIPVSAIKYVKQITKEEIFKKDSINCILFDGHTIPVYSIAEIFGEKLNNNNSHLTVIILESQNRQGAFLVEKLLGDQEVFQKKLVPPILKIKNINGFTTLSTGEICLIINPYELMQNTVLNNN